VRTPDPVRWRGLPAWLLVCGCWLASTAGAAPVQGAPAASAPTPEEVHAALDAVRADPDLPGTRKSRHLRFKGAAPEPSAPRPAGPEAPGWWAGLAHWLGEGGRLLVWAVAALALAWGLVRVRHWIQARAEGGVTARSVRRPSHVQDLDIRPESLPGEVGAAASTLWQRGEHRAALALLYRGALSRLVHGDGLPIRAASTEGECVALAAQRLTPARSAYVGRLVQAWQLAVYGGRLPGTEQVRALCAEFDVHLRADSAPPAPGAA